MTPDDAYAAGWADGAADPPLDAASAARLAALLAPHTQVTQAA